MSDYSNRGHCHTCHAREGECRCLQVHPTFEDWKLDLTNEKLSELACGFYEDKIGILYKVLIATNPRHNVIYELAEDAENFILEDIVAEVRFEDEFYDYLKKAWKEEYNL